MAGISFNRERALQVERALIGAYRSGAGPLADPGFIIAPEVRAVEGMGSLHQAQLLFYAVGSDHNVESEKHYPLFRKAYNQDPDSINPAVIAEMTESEVMFHFSRNYRMALTQTVLGLHASSSILVQEYGSDPRRLFDGITCVNEAAALIGDKRSPRKLPAYGRQLAKLLLKNYCELDLVEFPNEDRLPPKIDRHNMRISIATGVITLPKPGWYQSNALVDVLHDGWGELAMAGEIDGKLLNNLIWKIGSALCRQEDRNVCASSCPMYERECSSLPTPFLPGGRIYTRQDVRKPFDYSTSQERIALDEIIIAVKKTPLVIEQEQAAGPLHQQMNLMLLPPAPNRREQARKRVNDYFARIPKQ